MPPKKETPKKGNIAKLIHRSQITGKKISRSQATSSISSLRRIQERLASDIDRMEQQIRTQTNILNTGSISLGPDRQRVPPADRQRLKESIQWAKRRIKKSKEDQKKDVELLLWDEDYNDKNHDIRRPPPPPPPPSSGGAGIAV